MLCNVGAGLLAKAADQSVDILTDTPPSRASPLPHWRALIRRRRSYNCPAPGFRSACICR
ncbi:hypothetical protein GDV60_03590 [Pseudomonas sp. DTU12.1]|nr:hypothetical protein GDV60_03590 [Pseudomonas sp. DTU12.1]